VKSMMTTASGDGTTDDTPFLQADLHKLSQSTEPTRLVLSRGIYRIRSPLTFTAPTVATAIDGDFAVITPGIPGDPAAGTLAALLRLNVPAGAGPFELRRLTLNGSGLPVMKYVAAVGLLIVGGSTAPVRVESVLAYLCQIGFVFSRCDGFVVTCSRAQACKSVGWALVGGIWKSPIRLDSCAATGGPLHGLWCAPGAQATVAGFHAETNGGWGIVLGSEAAVFSAAVQSPVAASGPPVHIIGGIFEANDDGAIAVLGASSAKVDWPRLVPTGELPGASIQIGGGGAVDVTLPFISSSPSPGSWNVVPVGWRAQWTA